VRPHARRHRQPQERHVGRPVGEAAARVLPADEPQRHGFLTGTVTEPGEGDFRHNAPRFSAENLARNNDRYAPVKDLAASLGITPAQLALAWLLHQDEHVVPIPGSRTRAHIEENTAAAEITLHADTLARIDEALSRFEVRGATLL